MNALLEVPACQPYGQQTRTYTNSNITRPISDPRQFFKQFPSIFTLGIFVQNTVNCVWMKRKFSPLYDKKYFNFISPVVLEPQAEM